MLLSGIANIGLLSLGALAMFFFREHFGLKLPSRLQELLIGISFGLLAVLVVNFPVTIPLGATFDTRAAPAMLAGFFGGPIAGVTCGVIAAAARYWVGGRRSSAERSVRSSTPASASLPA